MSQVRHRALVTGASGFIGTRLCRRLDSMGSEVHGVSRRERAGPVQGVRWWQADLTRYADVTRVVAAVRPTLVVHLASLVSGTRDAASVVPVFSNNAASTVHVLSAAEGHGVERVLLTGSVEEGAEGSVPPHTPYAAAKRAASVYAQLYAALYGLDVLVVRPAMVYGPGQTDTTKLLPYLATCLRRSERAHLTSGRRLVDWVFVDDVVEAITVVAGADLASGSAVDIGSGSLVPVADVVRRFADLVAPREGRALLGLGDLDERPNEREFCADARATEAAIGWRAGVSLEEGLRLTAAWYENAGTGRT